MSLHIELNSLIKKLDKRCKKSTRNGNLFKPRVEGEVSNLPCPAGPVWAITVSRSPTTPRVPTRQPEERQMSDSSSESD